MLSFSCATQHEWIEKKRIEKRDILPHCRPSPSYVWHHWCACHNVYNMVEEEDLRWYSSLHVLLWNLVFLFGDQRSLFQMSNYRANTFITSPPPGLKSPSVCLPCLCALSMGASYPGPETLPPLRAETHPTHHCRLHAGYSSHCRSYSCYTH